MTTEHYPALKPKVVLVEGPEALGVYDLNEGAFHRLSLSAGPLLRTVDGSRPISSFSPAETEFLEECYRLGLTVRQTEIKITRQTELNEVVKPLRPTRFAWIEITSQCNQLCQHCFLGEDLNAHGHVPFEKILAYLPALERAGTRQIVLTGGEPFAHPDIRAVIEALATNYKFRLSILTNGTHTRVIKNLELLKAAKVVLKVPILGWRDSHDLMAGQAGAFRRLVRTLYALKRAGVVVELGCTITDINATDVPKIGRLANRLGFSIDFSPVYAVGFARQNAQALLGSGQQKIVDHCRTANKATRQRAAGALYPKEGREQFAADPTDYDAVDLRDYLTEHHECGQKIVAILANGTVTPCILLRGERFGIGSTQKDNLEAILTRTTRRSHDFDDRMHLSSVPSCSVCEARFICKAGGCPASAFAVHGSVQIKNPFFDGCYYQPQSGEVAKSPDRPVAKVLLPQ